MSTTDESLMVERTRFAGPPPPDPLDPTTTTLEDPTSRPDPDPDSPPADRPSLLARGRATATGTSTSSSERPDVAAGMAQAFVGLLVFVALGGRWLLARRGVEVMLPTEDERRAIASPLSRVAARHVPLELAPAVIRDVVDLSECAGAIHAYTEGAGRRRRTGELPEPAHPEESP